MRSKTIKLFSLALLFPFSLSAWQAVSPGLHYLKEKEIHLFEYDPNQFQTTLLIASALGEKMLSAKGFREKARALLVINGGFFDKEFRSLGLLVQEGKIVSPLRPVGWGIFQIQSGRPSIIHRKDWSPEGAEPHHGVTTALQVGPRLVIDGEIPSFKPEEKPHRRSALAVTRDEKILVAISEKAIPLQEWAEFLKTKAPNALNLDGGGSSQISVKVNGFSLELLGSTGVPNGIAILPK